MHIDDDVRMAFFSRLPVDKAELITETFECVEILDDLQVSRRIFRCAKTKKNTLWDMFRRSMFRHNEFQRGQGKMKGKKAESTDHTPVLICPVPGQDLRGGVEIALSDMLVLFRGSGPFRNLLDL